MTPSTILFISNSSHGDGAEVCLFRLMEGLDRSRFRPVLVMPGKGPMVARAEASRIPRYDVQLDWWIRADPGYQMRRLDIESSVEAIVGIIDREHPVLVHTNTSVVLSGAIAARRRSLPHVWHLHEVLEGHTELRSMLPLDDVYTIIDGLSDRVVTVSEAQRTECGAIDPRRLRTIRNGVPAAVAGPGIRRAIRRELGIADDAIVATSIGALIPRKGHDVLVDAAAIGRERGCEVRYLIVGTGESDDVTRLREHISRRGLDDTVSLVGRRNDVSAVLAASDMLVHPSRNEALPTVIVEAMAAGLPVVATDCGGTREVVDHGTTGSLVNVEDPSALADAIAALANDENMRRRLGASARARFEREYSLDAMTSAFTDLYDEVLTERTALATSSVSEQVARLVRRYQRAYLQRRMMARAGEMFARVTPRAGRS